MAVVGESVRRSDGRAKVTGEAQYAADLTLPGMLHVRLVLSPYAHARVVGVDRIDRERVTPAQQALPHHLDVLAHQFGVEDAVQGRGVGPAHHLVLPLGVGGVFERTHSRLGMGTAASQLMTGGGQVTQAELA